MDRTKVHVVLGFNDIELRGTKLDDYDKIITSEDLDYQFKPGHRYLVLWNDNADDKTWKEGEDQPYQVIKRQIHLGPRREGFYDLTKMDYLMTANGIYFKFIYKKYESRKQWLDEAQYNAMLPHLDQIQSKIRDAELRSGISKRTGRPWYRFDFSALAEVDGSILDFLEKDDYIKDYPKLEYYNKIRTTEEIDRAFDYFMSLPKDVMYGLDYETCGGMPFDDAEFDWMGVGVSTNTGFAAYFDMEWMQYVGGNFEYFKKRYKEFLDANEECVTYNNGFEVRATYLLLHKLYMFHEAATTNKLTGLVSKRFSLKYTAMKELHTPSWDDVFEALTDEWLPEIFGWDEDIEDYRWKVVADGDIEIESGQVDEDGNPIMITVRNHYKNNPLWSEMIATYGYEDEFTRLIDKNFGDPFGCIPSDILAKYCTMDAFNTVKLKEWCLQHYSQLAWDCYNSNLQLEALLEITGIFVDTEYCERLRKWSGHIIMYGRLNLTQLMLRVKMEHYNKFNIPDVPELTHIWKQGWDPLDTKSLLMGNLDPNSQYGVNEGVLYSLFPDDLVSVILQEIENYVGFLDEGYGRSRKLFNVLDQVMYDRYSPELFNDEGYCLFTINGVTHRVDLDYNSILDYYQTSTVYDEVKYLASQVHLDNIEEQSVVTKEGVEYDIYTIQDYCDAIYNPVSPKVSMFFKWEMYYRFKNILMKTYAVDYQEKIPGNQLNEDTHMTQEEFDVMYHHMESMTEEEFYALPKETQDEYLTDEWPLCKMERISRWLLAKDIDGVKQTKRYRMYHAKDWGDDFMGNIIKPDQNILALTYDALINNGCFSYICGHDEEGNPQYDWIGDAYGWKEQIDIELNGYYNHNVYYVGTECLSDEDREWFFDHIDEVNIEDRTPFGLAKVSFAYFAAKKYLKVLTTYVDGQFDKYNRDCNDFDENGVSTSRHGGGVIKCHSPFYACSKKSKRWAASLHTVPSKSETKRIVTCPPGYLLYYYDISAAEVRFIAYTSGDPYMIECFENKVDLYMKMARDCEPGNDDDYYRSVRGEYKQIVLGTLYGMGAAKMASMLYISEERCQMLQETFFNRAPKAREFIEKKSQWAMDHPGFVDSYLGDTLVLGDDDGDDRFARLGINQFVQNGASVALGHGFLNTIKHSIHNDDEELKDCIIRPLNVVHDSSQCYFSTTALFDIYPYCHRHLSDFLYEHYKVRLEFDFQFGANYFDVCDIKQIDSDHMELKGNYTSLYKLLKKCEVDGLRFRIDKVMVDSKKPEKCIEIPVNGLEIDPNLFKPELTTGMARKFFNAGGYANFEKDSSKYKVWISRVR